MPDMTPIGPIATAIAEVAKVIGVWMNSADRRKMQAAIEAGEMYIRISECEAPYEVMTTTKRVALLAYWKKRFFKSN